MPQFDLSHFSSQIFWFSLCFATLYYFVSKMLLPRIKSIIDSRKLVIDEDLSSAASLEKKIYNLQIKSKNLRRDASQNYQLKLEESSKYTSKEKEKAIAELKEKIEDMTKKSHKELKIFFEQSKARSSQAVEEITKSIKKKLFDSELTSTTNKNS